MSDPGRRLFGLDPAGYAAGRPGYPAAVFDTLAGRCRLRPGTATLEIGPGAGQATAELIARGAHPLTVVESDLAFARFLAERFGDRITVVNEPFEDADLESEGFDLAVSATAWHWVDQKIGFAKVASALRPGGSFAMVWNIFHSAEPDDLYRALDPLLESAPAITSPAGAPSGEFALDERSRVADLAATGRFDDINVSRLDWTLALDPLRARALFGTFSPILALELAERERVLDAIADVVATQFGGLAERNCVTILYTARRLPPG